MFVSGKEIRSNNFSGAVSQRYILSYIVTMRLLQVMRVLYYTFQEAYMKRDDSVMYELQSAIVQLRDEVKLTPVNRK